MAKNQTLGRIKSWARNIRNDVVAIYLAGRDRRTPWYVKAIAVAVAAYALSPIDLIPDFIPIVGYLDDLIIVPLGIMLVAHLIPDELMAEFRLAANERNNLPKSWLGGAFILIVWIVAAIALYAWLMNNNYIS